MNGSIQTPEALEQALENLKFYDFKYKTKRLINVF